MLCPYCNVAISDFSGEWSEESYPIPAEDADFEKGYVISSIFCPDCYEFIAFIEEGRNWKSTSYGSYFELKGGDKTLIFPRFSVTRNINNFVPKKYSELYLEASQVNQISPRASATLSRYLLQMILLEELKIKKKNLAEEISEFEKLPNVPSNLGTMLQVLRRVANFGAHPKKSTNSNEILEIEQGEADIMLELIEQLFDFQFVKPAQQEEFLKDIETKYGIKP